MGMYRFDAGQKVRICSRRNSSVGCKENEGRIVTIKCRCPFTFAYALEELDGLWHDNCFEAV